MKPTLDQGSFVGSWFEDARSRPHEPDRPQRWTFWSPRSRCSFLWIHCRVKTASLDCHCACGVMVGASAAPQELKRKLGYQPIGPIQVASPLQTKPAPGTADVEKWIHLQRASLSAYLGLGARRSSQAHHRWDDLLPGAWSGSKTIPEKSGRAGFGACHPVYESTR